MAGIKDLLTLENTEKFLSFLKNNQESVGGITEAKILPSSYNLFLRSLAGIDEPINESFFKKSELENIKEKIARTEIGKDAGDKKYYAEPGVIRYTGAPLGMKQALFDGDANLEMTLGRARYNKNEEGIYSLKDKYNFNNKSIELDEETMQNLSDEEILQSDIDSYKKGEISLAKVMRTIGGINLGGGPNDKKGTDININLGKITDEYKQNLVDKEIKNSINPKTIKNAYKELEKLNKYEKNPESMTKKLKKSFKILKNLGGTDYTISDFIKMHKEFHLENLEKTMDSLNSNYGRYSPYQPSYDFKNGGRVDKALSSEPKDI